MSALEGIPPFTPQEGATVISRTILQFACSTRYLTLNPFHTFVYLPSSFLRNQKSSLIFDKYTR